MKFFQQVKGWRAFYHSFFALLLFPVCVRAVCASTDVIKTVSQHQLMDLFSLTCPFTESSDEDEASGDEGLPDDDSDVSYILLERHLLTNAGELT